MSEIKTINMNDLCKKISETKEIIFEKFNVDVVKRNYWDSHGRLVPWQDGSGVKSRTIKNCHIKIEKIVTVEKWKYIDHNTETELWNVYINGELDNGDCYGYSQVDGKKVNLKMVYGWG